MAQYISKNTKLVEIDEHGNVINTIEPIRLAKTDSYGDVSLAQILADLQEQMDRTYKEAASDGQPAN